ncbi:uncharacterized protein LOC124461026 [Drosophila willistoni]|uniref:uncharacterized protein LOC124461026 n=1 Tax=Drosophila willistoni TaxID=7260 RepID=UPI001F081ADD|nr:uncharacterized protein LOC124461026 [Drosophila willistoni]
MDRFLQMGKRRNSKETCDCSSSESEKSSAVTTSSHKLKKKTKISDVWNYFKRSDDKKFAKCLNCEKEYKTSGNTSNLRDHLKRFHPSLRDDERNSANYGDQGDSIFPPAAAADQV